MRENYTQPDFYGIPILHDMDVQFDHASDIGNKPASCYTCCLHNEPEGTCMLIGPTLKVVKLLSKGIEYWPCCGNHSYGDPHGGKPLYLASLDPGNLGLIWINAPAVGQKYGGANCNGTEGGDDCDHYQVKEGENGNPRRASAASSSASWKAATSVPCGTTTTNYLGRKPSNSSWGRTRTPLRRRWPAPF